MRVLFAILLCAAPIVAQDTGVISGVIRNSVNRQPVEDAQVSLIGTTGTAIQTDVDGRFRFTLLPAGKYSLRVEKPGFVKRGPVEIQAGADPVTVNLDPLAQIEGRVLDDDGHPAQGVTVESASPQGRSVPLESSLPTQADGRFLLQNLVPGDHWIRVRVPEAQRADGYPASEYYPGVADLEQTVPIRLAVGQQMAGLTIRLRRVPMVTLRGRVIDLGKDEAARPREVAIDCEPGPISGSFARREVDAEGGFYFEGVPAGRHRLLVYRGTGSDDLPYSTTIDVGKDDVTVNLPPFANVAGVVKSTVNPWEGVLGIGVATEGAWRRNVVPDEDGSFTLRDLPPGEWSLRLESNNLHGGGTPLRLASVTFGQASVIKRPMRVTEGGNPPLVITLSDESGGIAGKVEEADPKDETIVFAVPTDGRPLEPNNSAHTGSDGSFTMTNLLPGDYQVSAWDLTSLRKVGYGSDCSDRAVKITVTNGQTAAVKLKRCNP